MANLRVVGETIVIDDGETVFPLTQDGALSCGRWLYNNNVEEWVSEGEFPAELIDQVSAGHSAAHVEDELHDAILQEIKPIFSRLREQGCAVCILLPAELRGVAAKDAEQAMADAGISLILAKAGPECP